jgi:hypothetical protein
MPWRVVVCCFVAQIMQDQISHERETAFRGSHCISPFECKLAALIAYS